MNKIQAYNRDKRRASWKIESSLYFSAYSNALQVNPLGDSDYELSPKIDLAILVGPLDVEHITWALEGALLTSLNNIVNVYIVTPSTQEAHVNQKIEAFYATSNLATCKIQVLTDEILLGNFPKLQTRLRKIPASRSNWYKQQLLKWVVASKSDRSCLIIDCELILLKPRLWVNSAGVQVHYVLNDLNPQYVFSIQKLFETKLPKVDFVSHCALFQKDILDILSQGDMENFLLKWLNSGFTKYHPAPICEWQTYASFLVAFYPNRIKVGFQDQPLVTDNNEIHKFKYESLRHKYQEFAAIYLSHKDLQH